VKRKWLDLLERTLYDCFGREHLQLLKQFGIKALRRAVRWPNIEEKPTQYDFCSLQGKIHAADWSGMDAALEVIHFGVPDPIDALPRTFWKRSKRFTYLLTAYVKIGRNRRRISTSSSVPAAGAGSPTTAAGAMTGTVLTDYLITRINEATARSTNLLHVQYHHRGGPHLLYELKATYDGERHGHHLLFPSPMGFRIPTATTLDGPFQPRPQSIFSGGAGV
jgi:hypothetical protein